MSDHSRNRRWMLERLVLGAGALALGGCAGSRKAAAPGEPITPTADAPPLAGASPMGHSADLGARSDRTARLLDRWNHRQMTPAPAQPVEVTGLIARRSWTSASPILARADAMAGISRITVHHDGMSAFTSRSQADATRRIESIRKSHVGKGWADIGYHYIIDPAGRVYEGRPVSLQGAHVKYNNPHNLGVMVLGNYMLQSPTPQTLAALDHILASMMRRYRVGVARVYTHQELRPTACPGTSIQQHMLSTRRGGVLARV